MKAYSRSGSRAAFRAHQERLLIGRGRLIGWLTIAGTLTLWVLGVARPLTSTGTPLPLLNTIELCILTVAVTQVHRPWCRRHIVGLSTAVGVQIAVFLALYGIWTGDLWILALRLATLNLVTAAVLPWGIAMQSIVAAASTLALALVHWNLNGTLDHPSTIPTLTLFVFSLPIAAWLNQADAQLDEALQEIEARKRAEEMLRESEQRFRGTFEQAAVGIAHVALDGRWLRVNRRLCDIVGYTELELRGRTFQDITHPDDLDKDLGYVRDMLDGKIQTYSMEKRYFRKDGSVVWIDLTVSIVREPSGRPKYFISVVQDIDARKQAQTALRESEERFRLIAETIDEVFWISDVELRQMFYISPGYELVWGRTRDSLYQAPRSFLDAIHPEDRARTIADLDAQKKGQPFDHAYRIIRPDGSIRWIWDRGFPVHNETGPVTRYVGVAQDITEQRRMYEQLRESEERFSNAFEYAPIGMTLVSLDGRNLRVNRAICQMLGYTREELLQLRPWDTSHPDDMLTKIEHLKRMVLGETDSWHLEVRYQHKLGHEVWGLSNTSIVRTEDGTPLYVISQVLDITEQRQAEQMRQRHQREAATVNDILRALNKHLDVQVAFPAVCAGLRELAGCAAVSLNLFDEPRECVTFVAADAPWAHGVGQDICLDAAEVPAVTDVLAGRPHVVRDLATELQFPLVRFVYEIGLRSVISLPLGAGNEVGGFLNLFWREVDGCQAGEMGLLTQVANAVAIAVEKSRLFEQVRASHERLEALSRRLIEVQETERRHVAHELHDEIGQTVTGMRLLLDTIDWSSAPLARARVEQVQQLVNGLLTQIRNLSLNLRPSMLDDLGLVPALVWLFGRYTAQTNVRVDFSQHGLERRFDPDIETVGYRVVQEALTNVARHAQVDHVGVRGWVEDSSLFLEVVDDGTGFDPDAVGSTTLSMGLTGMRERALRLAGRLSVESKPGAGTHVRLQMPVRTATPGLPGAGS
jgi:PAS domain S-box-containing protein